MMILVEMCDFYPNSQVEASKRCGICKQESDKFKLIKLTEVPHPYELRTFTFSDSFAFYRFFAGTNKKSHSHHAVFHRFSLLSICQLYVFIHVHKLIQDPFIHFQNPFLFAITISKLVQLKVWISTLYIATKKKTCNQVSVLLANIMHYLRL